jgi:hypothetical protein
MDGSSICLCGASSWITTGASRTTSRSSFASVSPVSPALDELDQYFPLPVLALEAPALEFFQSYGL